MERRIHESACAPTRRKSSFDLIPSVAPTPSLAPIFFIGTPHLREAISKVEFHGVPFHAAPSTLTFNFYIRSTNLKNVSWNRHNNYFTDGSPDIINPKESSLLSISDKAAIRHQLALVAYYFGKV